MKSVGNTLRTAREKKGFDLVYVSDILKIREKYLQALEEGNYSLFPSSLYIKGFLKNYAKLLDIPQDEILALFRREYTQKEKSQFSKPEPVVKVVKFVLKPGHIVSLFTILVVCAIAIYLVLEFKSFAAPPTLQITSPTQNEVVNNQTIVVNGVTDPGDKVTINGTSVALIHPDGSFSMTVNLLSGMNQLTIVATNTLNRTSTDTFSVIFNDGSLNTSPTTTQTSGLVGRLFITQNTALIHLETDGNTIIDWQILQPGTVKNFSANQSIVIQTGRPSVTDLTVNGKTIDLNGSGVVVEKTITLDAEGDVIVK